jgi:diguanylate cyclase (GGDEF)-like protein
MAEEVIGKRCADNVLNHVDETGNSLCLCGCPLHNTIQDGETREAKVYLHHKDGHLVPVTVRAIPMIDQNQIIGAVEIFIDDSEKHEAMKDIEEYKVLAMVDQLTGLPNRRHIDSFISSKYKEYKELDIKFGILFIDIDKFKNFNDNYGHDMGDEVLKMISSSFLGATRATDLIGRYGGEEFIGIFAGVNGDSLLKKAESLRMIVENGKIHYKENDLKITISIGATLINEEDTIDTIMKRADEMLYKSKENGRNRVTII